MKKKIRGFLIKKLAYILFYLIEDGRTLTIDTVQFTKDGNYIKIRNIK